MRGRASIAGVLAGMGLLMAAGWAVATEAFTVRFGASGGLELPLDGAAETALRVGQRADALSGDDPSDVLAPPPPPGGGVPLLYVSAFEPWLGQYLHDFRPQASSQTWELNLVGMTTGTAVTLRWRVEDGALGGLPLRLIDRESQTVLVADMTATTQFLCRDADRVLLVVYGDTNRPPLARCDQAALLQSDGSLSIPFAALLANDYDPDGDALELVRVGAPSLPAGATPGPGSTDYGTTALDPVARRITYTLPATFPPDWTGVVAFDYAVRDNGSPSPAESTAVVQLTVAPHVAQDPDPTRVEIEAGEAVELAYTIRHTATVQTLVLEYSLPLVGSGAALGFWPFLGDYADDAGGTPVIDPGYGADGIQGTGDDSGVVRLDFGAAVPADGTRLAFKVRCPANASPEATVRALARYRLAGARETDRRQTLAEVSIVTTPSVPAFVAGPGGTITVEQNGSTTTATAWPEAGYRFLRWTQNGVPYSSENPLILTGVTDALTLTARFEALDTVPPTGDFLASVSETAVATGRGLWNLTGAYSTTAHGAPLTLLLAHDARGRLTGSATYQAAVAGNPLLVMPIRGNTRGANGTVVLRFVSRGSDAINEVGAALGFVLTVDPVNRRLTGPMTGAVTIAGIEHPIAVAESPQTWAIAPPMDGTWSLRLSNLTWDPAPLVDGTALLTLSCGDSLRFLVRGRPGRDGLTLLTLSGAPGDVGASAMALNARIRTLEGTPDCGVAILSSAHGKGYGQTVAW